MEGDFITLLFYVVGLNLILCRKDAYLPLVIGLGTFNREQMIFLVVFYAVHLISQQELFDKRNILVVSSCVGAYLAVFLGLRLYFGFKAGGHTMSVHIARNTDWYHVLRFILPLWLAEVAGFVVLCALAFKKTNTFFKLSFLSLGLYGLLFFLSGNLWELAKFLPAFLIMIPMSLQILTGEFADEKVRGVATSN